jgi:hypothetical protein
MLRSLAFGASLSHAQDCKRFTSKFNESVMDKHYEDLVIPFKTKARMAGLEGSVQENLSWLITDLTRASGCLPRRLRSREACIGQDTM